jgi:hypothetical protein
MRRVAWVLSVLTIGAAVGITGGCKTMSKATGTRDVMLGATPDKVVEAVKGAMGELEIKVTGAAATKLDGEVNALTAQGDSITVKVNSEGENVSRMTVKVGTLGDKAISQSIIDATKKRIE